MMEWDETDIKQTEMDMFQLKYAEIGAFMMEWDETDIKQTEMDTFQLK